MPPFPAFPQAGSFVKKSGKNFSKNRFSPRFFAKKPKSFFQKVQCFEKKFFLTILVKIVFYRRGAQKRRHEYRRRCRRALYRISRWGSAANLKIRVVRKLRLLNNTA
jgi:hypothetical protein